MKWKWVCAPMYCPSETRGLSFWLQPEGSGLGCLQWVRVCCLRCFRGRYRLKGNIKSINRSLLAHCWLEKTNYGALYSDVRCAAANIWWRLLSPGITKPHRHGISHSSDTGRHIVGRTWRCSERYKEYTKLILLLLCREPCSEYPSLILLSLCREPY
jgi:hypothetical protein